MVIVYSKNKRNPLTNADGTAHTEQNMQICNICGYMSLGQYRKSLHSTHGICFMINENKQPKQKAFR